MTTTTATTSPALFSPSLLNFPTSKSRSFSLLKRNPLLESSISLRATLNNRRSTRFITSSTLDSSSSAIIENPTSSGRSSLNNSSSSGSGNKVAGLKIGARVRVSIPLKVYHVPKVPEFDLTGKMGVLKQFVGVHKGKPISANLPYKVEFVENVEGRDGPVKFFAHLKEDEFEYLD